MKVRGGGTPLNSDSALGGNVFPFWYDFLLEIKGNQTVVVTNERASTSLPGQQECAIIGRSRHFDAWIKVPAESLLDSNYMPAVGAPGPGSRGGGGT